MDALTVELPTTADDWTGYTGAGLDAKVRELDVVARRIEASIVGGVDHVERSGHYGTDGHRSVSSWLTATTNCTRGEATARLRSARLVRRLSRVAEEFVAGRVGVGQVRELARLAANPRAGDQVAGSEDVLLEAAKTLEFADFRVVTRRWEQLADHDSAHRDHERAHEDRNARCDFDGAVFRCETAHGVIQGTAMAQVFQAFCDAELDRDWQWTTDTYGDEATKSSMPRTAAQRRADAFVAMVLAAAQAGTGNHQPIDTCVNLVCDLDQYEQHVQDAIAGEHANGRDDTGVEDGRDDTDGVDGSHRGVGIDPATVRDRRCETTNGIPVDPRQLVAAATLGRIRSIVLDGAGVIVAAGRTRTLFTGAMRDAIIATDPVCGWLGCNLSAQLCAIDHLQPRSRGGPTDTTNAKIMCTKHNIFKHTANYTVQRQPDGTILITRPDGTHLQPPDAA